MKTVEKAMRVLGVFTATRPELGLSELARLAQMDKAAVRRLLVAMARHDFIEQVADSRKYRLGAGFLHLARVREASVPMAESAQQIADWLHSNTDQTSHISIPAAGGLTTIAFRMPLRGAMVTIDPGQLLPLHATASGLIYLGYQSEQQRRESLANCEPLTRFTHATICDTSEILARAESAASVGYAIIENSFESEVCGMAVPFFNARNELAGTIGMAVPWQQAQPMPRPDWINLLFEASRKLTRLLGGTGHPRFAQTVDNYVSVA